MALYYVDSQTGTYGLVHDLKVFFLKDAEVDFFDNLTDNERIKYGKINGSRVSATGRLL